MHIICKRLDPISKDSYVHIVDFCEWQEKFTLNWNIELARSAKTSNFYFGIVLYVVTIKFNST